MKLATKKEKICHTNITTTTMNTVTTITVITTIIITLCPTL